MNNPSPASDHPVSVIQLADNTKLFRSQMKAAGFSVGGDPDHPICPIMLGDARLASEFADEMLKRGIFVIGFSFPVSFRIYMVLAVGFQAQATQFSFLTLSRSSPGGSKGKGSHSCADLGRT
jgi:7-keto-8-aminopelargonate synthetase-like enzyme